jgi:cytidylate kinase
MKSNSTKIKEVDQIEFYQQYYNLDINQFREYCIGLINNARAPNVVLINQIKSMKTKDSILKSVNNFIMKGHGYGVLK